LKPDVALTAGYFACPVFRAAVPAFINIIHFEAFHRPPGISSMGLRGGPQFISY